MTSSSTANDIPRFPVWPVLGLLLLALLAMGSVVFNEFSTWDDLHTLVENPSFNPPTWKKIGYYWDPRNVVAALWVPVTYTVWGILAMGAYLQYPDANGVQLNPVVFHGASLLCHLIATILVYGLLRRMLDRYESLRPLGGSSAFGAPLASFFGAAVFAVHPIQVEAIAWTSGLKDMLSCVFSLAAVTGFVSALESKKPKRSRWWWIGLLCFILGTLSKPSSMTAPAIAFAFAWLGLQRPCREVARAIWPWFLWVPLVIIWTKLAQPGTGVYSLSLPYRPLIALDAVAFYMGKVLWPLNLTFDYSRRPKIIYDSGALWWTWIFPVAAAILLLRAHRQARTSDDPHRLDPLLGGLVMALIAVSPVLGLTKFSYQFYTTTSDHYFYPAMAGVACAVGWTLLRFRYVRHLIPIACVTLAVWMILAARQMQTWRDSETLYAHAIKVNPLSSSSFQNLGAVRMSRASAAQARGDTATAYSFASDALKYFDQAVIVRPDNSLGWDGRAGALFLLFRVDEGIASMEKALETAENIPPEVRKPTWATRSTLARVLVRRGDYDRALMHFRAARDLMVAEKRNASEIAYVDELIADVVARKAGVTTQPVTRPTAAAATQIFSPKPTP